MLFAAPGRHCRTREFYNGVKGLLRSAWRVQGRTLLRAVLAAGTLAGVAHAQNAAGDDDTPGAAASVSPIEGRGFSIGASLRTLYDSNIRRLGRGFTADSGQSKSDFRFTPTVSAAAALPVGRQQLFITGDLGRDIYARNSELNRNRYSLVGGAVLRAGRSCAGSIVGEARRRQSLVTEANGRSDNTQEITGINAQADCAPPVGFGFGGGISQRSVDNKAIDRQSLDSRETTFEAHLNYGASGLGVFSAGGSYSQFRYPRRDILVPTAGGGIDQVTDKLDSWSARLGYSRALGARLSINLSGSYIDTKPKPRDALAVVVLDDGTTAILQNPRDGYKGPGFGVGLDYHPGGRLGATLNASRNATSSPNVSARVVVRDNVTAAVSYSIGPSIDTVVGASYDRRSYRGTFATPSDPVPRSRDTTGRIFARASYSPRPLYGVDFEIAHQKRDSNPSIYSFSSTSAVLTLRAKFGRG